MPRIFLSSCGGKKGMLGLEHAAFLTGTPQAWSPSPDAPTAVVPCVQCNGSAPFSTPMEAWEWKAAFVFVSLFFSQISYLTLK